MIKQLANLESETISVDIRSSASYDTNRRECYLSPDDRYTKPRAFQTNPIYDYIENQCAPTGLADQFVLPLTDYC